MANKEYAYLAAMRQHFSEKVNGQTLLFRVDVEADKLWDAYLMGFRPELRQEHNCNCCRAFIKNYGNVVLIDKRGNIVSPFWGAKVDSDHAKAFENLNVLVMQAKVSGVFLSSETTWGTIKNFDRVRGLVWEHLAVMPPAALVYRSRTVSAGQAMAYKRQEYDGLKRAFDEFSKETVEQALALANSGALRRAELVKPALQWFQKAISSVPHSDSNLLWPVVASAPAGMCFIRSGLAGSLMQDIADGLSANDVKRRYEDKADPSQYQRAQVAPSAGNIQQAEQLVKKLGLETALIRRYASVDEVQLFWRSQQLAAEQKVKEGTVFGHLKPKVKEEEAALNLPKVTMTWEKFKRTVLQSAVSIEVLVPESTNRFAGIVTAYDPDAAPILQWDKAESRNPFSWYYADGVDASIRKRVQAAGGQVDNVDIRASLSWGTYTDLDLHCKGPRGYIYFGNKRDSVGGALDVDMNISADTLTPVENIRWGRGRAPDGAYEFFVRNHTNRSQVNHFKVELELFGKMYVLEGKIGAHEDKRVATIQVKDGRASACVFHLESRQATANSSDWGLASGQWSRVNGLCLSPNLWNTDAALEARGKHVFFLLDGCQDKAEGVGRGFFSEFLINDLKPVRSTLEAYTAEATLYPAPDGNPACGLGMSDTDDWNLTVRAKTKTDTRLILIDRWD